MRKLFVFWTALAASPVGCFLHDGLSATSTVIALVYTTGWLFLLVAARRPSTDQMLSDFSRSGAATAALFLLTTLVVTVVQISVLYGQALLLVAVTSGVAVAAFSESGTALANRIGRCLLLVTSLVFLIAVGEVALRIAGSDSSPSPLRYDRTWEHNPLGFRSLHAPQPDHPKPPGTFRVMTLGDSFTWGHGIAATEKTWPFVLENMLTQAGCGPVEVINAAQRGYTTVNEAEALGEFGWDFQPDLVILQTLLNDVLPSRPGYQSEEERWYFHLWSLLPADAEFERASYVYRWLNSRFRIAQKEWFYPTGFSPLYTDSFSGWQDCRALQEMSQQAQGRGVPLLVVQFPDFLPGTIDDKSYRYVSAHRALLKAAEDAGLETLDLLPVYAQQGKRGETWWASPADAHPNETAHAIAAAAVAQKLRALQWLPEQISAAEAE